MVHLDDFDDFYQRAVILYRADPCRVRYTAKYRHCDGYLIFKVTDNTKARNLHNLISKL
jgi:signal recognition particle subunit SRP9